MTAIERVKYAVKVAVAHTLYALGLLQLWQAVVLRRKAVVLMYHRVLTEEEQGRTGSHPGIIVGRDTFERQMALLRRRFVVLSLEEFADHLEQGVPFRNSSCLITFDDGWADNFTHALPILRSHGLPAVVFLPVALIGGRRMFWQEALTHLVLGAVNRVRIAPDQRERLRERLAPAQLEGILGIPDDEDPRPAVIEAVRNCKGLAALLISATLTGLADELGVGTADLDGVDRFLDWEQIHVMSQHGIQFGGHGTKHEILTQISQDEATSEIREAKEVVNSRLKPKVLAFSYPNGNWNRDIAELVRASGYRVAFTTECGAVRTEDDRFALQRVNIHEKAADSAPLFLARVVGLF